MSTKLTFGRVLLATFGVLILLAGIFITLITLQGQRVRYATIDTELITQERNQRIVLSLAQPIESIIESQVTLTPTASFTTLTNGESIVIQLKERLRYDTKYEVKLSNLSNVSGKQNDKELTYVFKTASPTLTYLKRNSQEKQTDVAFFTSKMNDEIYSTGLDNAKDDVIFSTPMIQEYCRIDNKLIVAILNEDGSNTLKLVDVYTKSIQDILLPENQGTISLLHCAPSSGNFGYLLNSEGTSQPTLFTANILNISEPKAINGVDGKPLQPGEWNYAPDGTSIITNDYESGGLLIDGSGKQKPVPLGQIYSLHNFTYDGRGVAVTDRTNGLFVLDIPTLRKSPIADPNDQEGSVDVVALSNTEGWIKRTAKVSSDTLRLETPSVKKEIYSSSRDKSSIFAYATSPNDQYLLVTYERASAMYDTYAGRAVPEDLYTEIYDLNTRQMIKQIPGFDPLWY